MNRNKIIAVLAAAILFSCQKKEKELPILGFKDVTTKVVNGQQVADTVYHTIGDFKFMDQDSAWVTNQTFDNKIYVADFFFTTCPSICPAMQAQMLRVYDKYKDDNQVQILSHTIDPDHDSIPVLRDYAGKLDVKAPKWHFVTGNKDDIYTLGEKSYMVRAAEDQFQPGGYIHSGAFVLVDNHRRIRGIYDGTKPEDVDRLLVDMDILLKEVNSPDE